MQDSTRPDAVGGSQAGTDRGELAAGRSTASLMAKDKLMVLMVFAVAIGGTVSLQFARTASGPATNKGESATPAGKPLDMNQFRGVCMQMHNGDDSHPYDKFIREIAATGANTLCLTVPTFQQNAGSSSIFIESRKTPSPKRLRELIDLAHELKMRVILMPIVLLENPREGEWRGKIDPTKDKNTWDDWWENYTNCIMYFAHIAQDAKVEVFMVGSELVSVEPQTDRWVALIKQVRGAFSGYLSYSSNWDHYKPIKFWNKLDIVGMTTYYDLCGSKSPTLPVMLETWKDIKKELLAWQAKVGRPILFTEVGWPNQETAAQYPWDYYRAQDKPDPQLQKRCFESYFQTWADDTTIAGYLVWEWRSFNDHKTDPQTDTSYCPKDKPAMEVISHYFRLPNGHIEPLQAGLTSTQEAASDDDSSDEKAADESTSPAMGDSDPEVLQKPDEQTSAPAAAD